MCGIVGVVRFDEGDVSQTVVQRMARTMHHRGPDGEGFLFEPGVGLGHQRLSIIDIASGQQPMTAGNNTIVFNGEIYNYIELREELKAAGYSFRTASDRLLRIYIAFSGGPPDFRFDPRGHVASQCGDRGCVLSSGVRRFVPPHSFAWSDQGLVSRYPDAALLSPDGMVCAGTYEF